ncbi:hypothetical protein ACJ72_01602 [Emergomyces africanus]|uniref:Brix domain-containing protein n=1 Tax=Emergomyces africanus TaxID=1955775 RepID=A0A1B7P4R8_9EURO|nr:hypothetical protein ACJ72_01602 [Emergomyces africanus]
MASVYKSLSKKKSQPLIAREETDISMQDMLDDPDETSDSDDYEDETEQEGRNGREDGVVDKSQSLPSGYLPKTRVLMLTSRGVTHRHRHLLSDLSSLLPHTHKESKLDTKKKTAGYNFLLNSLADLHSCNVIFFLEAKKRGQDLYLWLSRPPNGPTIKFSVSSLHTMGEMGTGFAGNCLKGGRGVVVFDKTFDEAAVMRTGNEFRGLCTKTWSAGDETVCRSDHWSIWCGWEDMDSGFEIRESEGGAAVANTKPKDGEVEDGDAEKPKPKPKRSNKGGAPDITLVEIGPRFVLTPIVILEGSFGGPVIYENKEFVSPNQVRREIRLRKASRFATRNIGQTDRTVKRSGLGLTTEGRENRRRDPLETKEVFG